MTDDERNAEFPTEALALERLTAIARHHGWSPYQTLWRIVNGMLHESPPLNIAQFFWGLDFVASEETKKPMFDEVLPADRESDPLLNAQRRAAEVYTTLKDLTLQVLAEADGPLNADEIKERTWKKYREGQTH